MNKYFWGSSACILMVSPLVWAQNPTSTNGMQTYSPYTAEQIKQFNNQPLSPAEGPFGPVAPNSQEVKSPKASSLDAKYYNQPKGEEEAEALETESASPYQSVYPTIAF